MTIHEAQAAGELGLDGMHGLQRHLAGYTVHLKDDLAGAHRRCVKGDLALALAHADALRLACHGHRSLHADPEACALLDAAAQCPSNSLDSVGCNAPPSHSTDAEGSILELCGVGHDGVVDAHTLGHTDTAKVAVVAGLLKLQAAATATA
eukprot:CAMPEP_0202920668 /NCGR_PEP_ID=MMETSP1392-20130828/76978_1 /ASSEMBLY_ACC=CAM_ASM_000868 /TAXON_ID=225041 /ORGANISM="Chlamydomonas chlamydogama, Strain SAG 11-48b" /LENGTH=149 /DNA_ID=CAMNT_0049614175 /DNA_START=525 /DNA_END=975 /DNA_ORIENTATION=-